MEPELPKGQTPQNHLPRTPIKQPSSEPSPLWGRGQGEGRRQKSRNAPHRTPTPLTPADSVTVEAIRTSFLTYTDLYPKTEKNRRTPRRKLLISTRGLGFLIIGHAEGQISGFEIILPRPFLETPLESLPGASVLTKPPLVRFDPEDRPFGVRTVTVNRNAFTGPAHPERLVSRFADLGDIAIGLDITGHLGFVGLRTALLQAHRPDREGSLVFHGSNASSRGRRIAPVKDRDFDPAAEP